uniref:Uncharacterized protein n=1 Tax=Anas platyrhynchos TaxID=8839 RepID=A0A8B9T8U9_ANAPL
MGERGSECVFWGPSFQLSPMPARDIYSVARKERTWKVQLHVGLHKGSPGEFTCTQSLPLGALLDGPRGIAMRFLSFQSSAMRDRVIYSFAVKERIRMVQLHVRLRKGSPGEFSCTQSLPLGALLDGRMGLEMLFLWPLLSVFCHAG